MIYTILAFAATVCLFEFLVIMMLVILVRELVEKLTSGKDHVE